MSIRTKIFFGCISLTLVTFFVGLLALNTQTTLSATALGIYDDALQPTNYLRSAQSIILGVSRDIAGGEKNDAIFAEQLRSALDALDVAHERAMSSAGEALTRQLQSSVSNLQSALADTPDTLTRREFYAIEQTFDRAVGVYASDGFRLRRSAEALVQRTRHQTYAAMLGSVLTAIVIAVLLSRAIVPSIRQAVSIATAIAAGKLDNRIEGQGSGETGLLLQALATMQANIAEKLRFIQSLMTQQASSHDIEIAAQNARFETALNHMTLGLRMYDADNRLVVQNQSFSEMFDTERAVAAIERAPPADPSREGGPARDFATGSGTYFRLLDDGRTIEVSEEAMADGGRVVTYEDISARQLAEDRLSHMVRHDALTGLPNRVLFREQLQRETGAARQGRTISVLCLDLDRFKTVNDTLGHPVGDELLRAVATRLVRAAGDAGTVARLGGDEFAVIQSAPRTGGDARILAARLIESLTPTFEIGNHRIAIGVSIGIAQTDDGSGTPDELLKNADLALYSAKADRRGIFRVFEPDMNARMQARSVMEIDLRAAIANQQFEVYYQPLVGAETGAVVAFEALVRWHHPEKGMISPADFIPVAEETGQISMIGLWVLNQACRDAKTWPAHIKVAVNLSPLQFQYRNIVEDVENALRQSGLCAGRLDLEITESLMLQDSDKTLSTLHDLRSLGVRISMDDFGTGYSSLSYLRQFPFDKIKIDRSFIRDVVESTDGLAIVKAVIQIGESLRMKIVAEGVETFEQKRLLCEAGCQELQGYYFSRPQPADFVLDTIDRLSLKRAA